jgi:hypothetical protein
MIILISNPDRVTFSQKMIPEMPSHLKEMQKHKYNKDMNVRNDHKSQLAQTILTAEGSWGSSDYSRIEARRRAAVSCAVARTVTLKQLNQSASVMLLHIIGQGFHKLIKFLINRIGFCFVDIACVSKVRHFASSSTNYKYKCKAR